MKPLLSKDRFNPASSAPELDHRSTFTGVVGAAKPLLAAQLFQRSPNLVVVAKDTPSLEQWESDLQFVLPDTDIFSFPAWDALPFEPISPDTVLSAQRLRAARALKSDSPCIVVTTLPGLLLKTLPAEVISQLVFRLQVNDRINRDELIHRLDVCGYRKTSLVEEVGDYAIRGRVVDIFSSTSRLPLRLEFVDDTIERMKLFELSSQRSTRTIACSEIYPVREYVPLGSSDGHQETIHKAIDHIKQRGRELETPPREVASLVSAVRNAIDVPGIEYTQPYILGGLQSLFDHCTENPVFLIEEGEELSQHLEEQWSFIQERAKKFERNHHFIPRLAEMYLSAEECFAELNSYSYHSLSELSIGDSMPHSDKKLYEVKSRRNSELSQLLSAKRKVGEHFPALASKLQSYLDTGYQVTMVIGSESRARRLQEHLLECELKVPIKNFPLASWMGTPRGERLSIQIGQLSSGANFPDLKRVILSEQELFGERSYRRTNIQAKNIKRLLSSLAQLKDGDHVVHVDFGIGIYRGLKPIVIEEEGTELLQIEYLDSVLYLPVHNISKIQKFSAAEGQSPQLDKLGSNRWKKVKLKVKNNVIELAGDLIKLYAARDISKGWRFEPYGALDEQFAEEFAYNETEDQLNAIHEALEDMSLDKPMDRLVCGDVGFGKTEVALRAAYKCVQHARQVALLAPTTILVEQHKETFEKRFSDYPVKIGVVSRFYKSKEIKETLEKLESGEIDIIIGTHRLLSNDVVYKDLGLLIVDEEHRFGVKQKEKVKQLKSDVDVLTLTATPIPRTLHMSLLDIRDISLISTPPVNRRVIRSHIALAEDGTIRDAILREINRGGQCFFVHNRVQGLDLITSELSDLVPEARFRFAHGQMTEKELEKIMWDFIHHEFDVLVCTTIIESGIDISNANTILINRAHAFGLAQLYQLRGRVGRSSRQAYCYFLVPKKGKLGRDAKKRLEALQSLDDLGQGFNLAMRDLEIRGAGNLLGKEQSGNVLSVGFELYSKILSEAVTHVRGLEPDLFETIDPEVKIEANAYIPEYYIPDVSERLILYQRFSALRSDLDGTQLFEEIEDRFGPPPGEVENLLHLMCFRSFLRRHGVVKAELNKTKVTLAFSRHAPIEIDKLIAFVNTNHQKYKLSKSLSLTIYDPIPGYSGDSAEKLYNKVQKVLLHLASEEKVEPNMEMSRD